MKRLQTAVAVALAALPMSSGAQPDTSSWTCRFCPFESGFRAWLDPSAIYVGDGSLRFGDDSGLDGVGTRLDLAGGWRYRDAETADDWEARFDRLGLDSRTLIIRGGRQGTYGASLQFEALPHILAQEAATPFRGHGMLALTDAWTRAGSTSGMDDLPASLRPLAREQRRERTRLDLAATPDGPFDYRFGYRRDRLEGTTAIGGSFMTLASQLPRRIDQATDRFALSTEYGNRVGSARLSVMSSYFANALDALAWQNPYSGPTTGSSAGQLALAPDNSAHRATFALGLRPLARLRLNLDLALGRMEQDEPFLPATINPEHATALPRNSAGARVDSTRAFARAVLGPWRTLRLTADVLYDEHDNRTPVERYPQVVMDTFTAEARPNVPRDTTHTRWRIGLERYGPSRLALGVDGDMRERRRGTIGTTRERTSWARAGWRLRQGVDVGFRVSHAERQGTASGTVSGAAAQNPLLRTFHDADRRREEIRGDLAMVPADFVTAGFDFSYVRNEYPHSVIGRTHNEQKGYGARLGVGPVHNISVSVFAEREGLEASQSGSQSFGVADWFATQDDRLFVAGLRAERRVVAGLTAGVDYAYTRSAGTVFMMAGGGQATFPAVVTRWADARAFARYPLRADLSLQADLRHERFRADDWATDEVNADTVPNLLAQGERIPRGRATAVWLGVRYDFGTSAAD